PEKLTLYSIDGNSYNPGEGPKTDETFHGYAVLGKIDVADPEKRKEIMAALKEGIDASDGRMAKCFWPRHAIRAEQAGKVFEYVICFQCEQMEVYAGIRKQTVPIADTPQQYFNRLLTDDKVPLAPSWEELT